MTDSTQKKDKNKYAAAGDLKIIHRLRIKFCAIMMLIVVAFLAVVFTVQYISNKRTMDEQSENALRMAIERAGRQNNGGFNPDDFVDPNGGGLPDGINPPDGTNPPDGMNLPDGTSMPDGSESGENGGNQNPDSGRDGNGGGRDDRKTSEGDGENRDYFPDFRDRDSMDGISTTPVMCVILSDDGSIEVMRNDIFFIENEDADTLVEAAENKGGSKGVLDDYKIRFMKKTLDSGETVMAFADISTSMSLLSNQLKKSLWISLAVTVVMFVVSLFISRWAVKPVERAMVNQKRFVADASHELKTPLAVIISNTDMVIKSENIDGKNKRRLDNIKAESARMKELVQELVDLARGDSAENRPAMEEVDLSGLVADDLLSWDPVAFDAGRSIMDDISEDISVRGNRDKLKQLLDILIDNAIKYSFEKSEISVSLKKTDKKAVLSVKNSGKALTEEEKAHVFDRFYRADESREAVSGYGLGLSIAVQIAELHKGRLSVESERSENGDEFNIFKLELTM